MMRKMFLLTLFVSCGLWLAACQENAVAETGRFVRGNYAYVGGEAQVDIVDVSDPENPQRVSSVAVSGPVQQVVSNGRFIYVAHRPSVDSWNSELGPPDGGLTIIDVSDPERPHQLGSFVTPDLVETVAVVGETAYVGDWSTVHILDASNPRRPESTGNFTEGASSLLIDGDRLYTSAGSCNFRSGYCFGEIGIFDITNPKLPRRLGNLQPSEMPAYDTAVANEMAFITGKGVWMSDVSQPTQLTQDGFFPHQGGFLYKAQVEVINTTAYVVWADGLHVLDVSEPLQPVELAYLPLPHVVRDAFVQGEHLYLNYWNPQQNGLFVVNVSNRERPFTEGVYVIDPQINS